jgi:hypothetical protein
MIGLFPNFLREDVAISATSNKPFRSDIPHVLWLATTSHRSTRSRVAQDDLVSTVPFSLYVIDMTTPSRHVELALYAVVTALVATSRSPSLPVGYLEIYLGRLQHWLRDWRIPINISEKHRRSLLRQQLASKSPDKSSFSEDQYSLSKQHSVLEWP